MDDGVGSAVQCPLLRIGYSEVWKRGPIRDLTDFAIILTLLNYHWENKRVNMVTISEITGISRATASRRIKYLIDKDAVIFKKYCTSTFIELSDNGLVLANSLIQSVGCPMGVPV